MKKLLAALMGGIVVIALILIFTSLTVAQAPDSEPKTPPAPQADDSQPGNPNTAAVLGDDSQPSGVPEVAIPQVYQPSAADLNAPQATPAATVYFTPQDENTSTTVLFLYNTGTVTQTVGLQTFNLTGSKFVDTHINVPPKGLVRICADPVSTISSTWQNVVLVNFTTSSTYARMTLPAGVKADGYVVWNNGNNYDPLQVAPTLPLRFSTDPATVLLPTVSKNNP